MSSHATHYSTNEAESLTYLEFGSVDTVSSEKSIWDRRLHQEAYDFFMLARYMKDLMVLRKLNESESRVTVEQMLTEYDEEVYTRDLYNSFTKIAALGEAYDRVKSRRKVAFMELGSTLMGCIESLEFVETLSRRAGVPDPPVPLARVRFLGVDISELLNRVAEDIHSHHTVTTYKDVAEVNDTVDVFFAKGVSLLYALPSVRAMATLLTRSACSVFDYSFTFDSIQTDRLGTGKTVSYLPLRELLRECHAMAPDKVLYFKRNTIDVDAERGRVRCACVFVDQEKADRLFDRESALKKSIERVAGSLDARAVLYYDGRLHGNTNPYVAADEWLATRRSQPLAA